MAVTVALAGDVMLGRKVAEHLDAGGPVVDDDLAALARSADLFVANLECCISARGERWPEPRKPFFFRAPPAAAEVLAELGVDVVTLANNHALDYGETALADTLAHLDAAGIAAVGAGADVAAARRPVTVAAGGLTIAVHGLTDHPAAFAATAQRPGVAYADLAAGLPDWVGAALAGTAADVRLVSPHWGPNMVAEPVAPVRDAAHGLVDAGADVVAGHSAHVVHGVEVVDDVPVLYDLGDFVDDYAVDAWLRNDLGLLWLVTVDAGGVQRIEAVPLRLDFCVTRLATGDDAAWLTERLRAACAALGTSVHEHHGRLRIEAAPG